MQRDELYPGTEPVTFDVECGFTATSPGYIHPVTLYPDWSLDTGHNTKLEKIATALGSPVQTCSDLVETCIPAIRDWRRHCHRLGGFPLHIVRGEHPHWCLPKEFPHCSDCRSWSSFEDGMLHLRSLSHWLGVHGATHWLMGFRTHRVWADMVYAGDWWGEVEPKPAPEPLPDDGASLTILDIKIQPSLPVQSFSQRSSPKMPAAQYAAIGLDRSEAKVLWTAGIHPSWAQNVDAQLNLGEPIWAGTFVQIAAREVPIEWLRQFVDGGARVVDWAARQYDTVDTVKPRDRAMWWSAGVGTQAVKPLMNGPYTPDDVQRLAKFRDAGITQTAGYLGEWLKAGCRPRIDQIQRVLSLPMSMQQAPNKSMLLRLRRLVGPAGEHLSTTNLGLVLAAAGTVPDAACVIKLSRQGIDGMLDFIATIQTTTIEKGIQHASFQS